MYIDKDRYEFINECVCAPTERSDDHLVRLLPLYLALGNDIRRRTFLKAFF